MANCKTCQTPMPDADAKEYCSHSCAVEAEIFAADAPLAPPKIPGFTAETAPQGPALAAPGGVKHDASKLPLHLLPVDCLEAIAQVLEFGAKKYVVNNWRKGIVYSRLFAAAMRHWWAWWRGQDVDPETGYHHLAHAGCCTIFALHFALQGGTAAGAVLDDRKEHNA